MKAQTAEEFTATLFDGIHNSGWGWETIKAAIEQRDAAIRREARADLRFEEFTAATLSTKPEPVAIRKDPIE